MTLAPSTTQEEEQEELCCSHGWYWPASVELSPSGSPTSFHFSIRGTLRAYSVNAESSMSLGLSAADIHSGRESGGQSARRGAFLLFLA